MSTEKNVQIVKNFLAALGRRDKQDLLALSAEDIEWIIPGEDWPLAGTHRGQAGLNNLLQKANETVEAARPAPPSFSVRTPKAVWQSRAPDYCENPCHAKRHDEPRSRGNPKRAGN